MLSAASAPRTSAVPRGFYVVTGLELFVFAGLPLVCLGLFAHFLVGSAALFDFHTFWQSGRDVLRGHSPYPTHLPSAATRTSFRPFVYPVPAAYVMAPFALLPVAVAQA